MRRHRGHRSNDRIESLEGRRLLSFEGDLDPAFSGDGVTTFYAPPSIAKCSTPGTGITDWVIDGGAGAGTAKRDLTDPTTAVEQVLA